MNRKRTIALITTSRADYSHLYWPLCELAAHLDVDLKLIVMGSHRYAEDGVFSVRVVITDSVGATATVVTPARIADPSSPGEAVLDQVVDLVNPPLPLMF